MMSSGETSPAPVDGYFVTIHARIHLIAQWNDNEQLTDNSSSCFIIKRSSFNTLTGKRGREKRNFLHLHTESNSSRSICHGFVNIYTVNCDIDWRERGKKLVFFILSRNYSNRYLIWKIISSICIRFSLPFVILISRHVCEYAIIIRRPWNDKHFA